MKIKPEHFAQMKDAIAGIPAEKVAAHRQFILNEGKAKDVEMRLRWDLLHSALGSRWICDNLYPYANDDHIDTALRNIVAAFHPKAESEPELQASPRL